MTAFEAHQSTLFQDASEIKFDHRGSSCVIIHIENRIRIRRGPVHIQVRLERVAVVSKSFTKRSPRHSCPMAEFWPLCPFRTRRLEMCCSRRRSLPFEVGHLAIFLKVDGCRAGMNLVERRSPWAVQIGSGSAVRTS